MRSTLTNLCGICMALIRSLNWETIIHKFVSLTMTRAVAIICLIMAYILCMMQWCSLNPVLHRNFDGISLYMGLQLDSVFSAMCSHNTICGQCFFFIFVHSFHHFARILFQLLIRMWKGLKDPTAYNGHAHCLK